MPSTLKRHGYSLLTTTTHEPTSPFYFNATIHITPKLQELELFYGGNCVPCHFCYQRYFKIERRSMGWGWPSVHTNGDDRDAHARSCRELAKLAVGVTAAAVSCAAARPQ